MLHAHDLHHTYNTGAELPWYAGDPDSLNNQVTRTDSAETTQQLCFSRALCPLPPTLGLISRIAPLYHWTSRGMCHINGSTFPFLFHNIVRLAGAL